MLYLYISFSMCGSGHLSPLLGRSTASYKCQMLFLSKDPSMRLCGGTGGASTLWWSGSPEGRCDDATVLLFRMRSIHKHLRISWSAIWSACQIDWRWWRTSAAKFRICTYMRRKGFPDPFITLRFGQLQTSNIGH